VPRLAEPARLDLLDDAARIHDEHPVAEGGDQLQVVRDEDEAHAALGHEAVEDVEDLHLHGDVERRGRLVGDEKVGIRHQHHGDHGPLSHPARDLVRVQGEHPRGVADLHGFQHRQRLLPRPRTARPHVGAVGLHDLVADGHHRIERVLGVLHHHADAPAAQLTELPPRGSEEVDAVEGEAPCRHFAGRRGEAQDGASGLRLAGARLADDAEPLPAEREGDPAHRLHGAGAQMEADAQVVDGEEGRAHEEAFGSSTSRRPSPRRLNPRLTTKIASPGTAATHHWSIR
jgi:hypothetical protein